MNYTEKVTDFIVENFLFGDKDRLKNETLLFEEGIIDSTGVLELVSFIEENYNTSVSDEELVQENFASINSISKFLQNKLSSEAA